MIVKGYELLKMVDEGKITKGTIVKTIGLSTEYFYDGGTFWQYEDNKLICEEMHASTLLRREFEILEKENKKIEEYNTSYTERCIDKEVREKLNEVIRAVNKLNEQIENNKDTNCMSD